MGWLEEWSLPYGDGKRPLPTNERVIKKNAVFAKFVKQACKKFETVIMGGFMIKVPRGHL